jgi:putative ABC transport system permease protein
MLPGVLSAAAIDAGVPLSGIEFARTIAVPGQTIGNPTIAIHHITRDYPTTIRLPLLRGRFFSPAEDRSGGMPVVLLNAAAVGRFFPGRDPLGVTVGVQGARTVIGIVGNTRVDGPEGHVEPEAYLPMAQTGIRWGTLMVRTAEPPAALAGPLTPIVSAVAPDAKTSTLESLDETFSHLVAARRLSMLLFAMFGVLAMAMAAVGIYGVVSYLVEQRTKEFGVRMALGATPGRILRQLLAQFTWILGGGVMLGLLAAWGLARFVAAFLFEVPAHAVGVYAAVATVVVLSGLLATVLPARRAARVDPLVALRAE